MFDNFEAISNDPRSGKSVFRGLKRNTTYTTGEYCTYEWHNFGVAAEGSFVTVTADAVGDKAFDVYANSGNSLDYHPLWDGTHYLRKIEDNDGPWEVPAEDIYEPRLGTSNYILSQTNKGTQVWRSIERENEETLLLRMVSLGGRIKIYHTSLFNQWLLTQSDTVQMAIRNARREMREATSWRSEYLEIIIADPRTAMFGPSGEDDRNWVDNIQQIG